MQWGVDSSNRAPEFLLAADARSAPRAVEMGDHHGFLIKEGAVVKSWKKRYFVLKNEELTYSKKDNADNLGAIDMEDVKHVHPVEYKKKKFCFAVETPKRTYYLVADDEKYRTSLPHRTLIPAQNS